MSRRYKISDPNYINWIYIDRGKKTESEGYISYRNVICQAIHFNLPRYDDNTDRLKNELFNPLMDAFSKKNNLENNDHFINLYFIKENTIVFLIDKTHGCFPLMFDTKNFRIDALEEALNDINSQWDKIAEVIKKHKEIRSWAEEIENELNEVYNHTTSQ